MKRLALLSATAMLLAFAAPSPVSAATPPPPTLIFSKACADGFLNTNTVEAAKSPDGKIHGFAQFLFSSTCGDKITYFEGSGSSWTVKSTSLVGKVVDVAADSTGSYLLYIIHEVGIDELALVKRANNGTMTRTVFEPLNEEGAQNGRGSLVAAGGKWFAVWPELTAGRYVLRQAGTMFGGVGASGPVSVRVPSTPAGDDTHPALTLGPNGQPRLFWQRAVAGGTQDLLFSSGTSGAWGTANRVAAAVQLAPASDLDLAITDQRNFLTWTSSVPGQADAGYSAIVASGSPGSPGSWVLSAPPGFIGTWDAHLVASSSSVFAAFGTGDDPHGDVYLGSKLGSAPWSTGGITNGIPASIDTFGVAGLFYYGSGKTTTLVFDNNELYAVQR